MTLYISKYRAVVGIAALAALAGIGCGPPAIDASKVKKLEVTATGPKAFCPMTKTPLGVDAVMDDGVRRATHAKERKSQFDASELLWTVTPPTLGSVISEKVDVAFTSAEDLSPLLEKDVTLSVSMKKNPAVTATFDIAPDFSCPQTVSWGGSDGASGYEGEGGEHGVLGKAGGSGARGGDGEPGKAAPPLEVAIKLIETPKRGKVAVVRVTRPNEGESATYFVDPTKGSMTVANRGGNGGTGGPGGGAGDGSVGDDCRTGAPGGNGGDGGNGANGGEGGAVTVRFDASHPELKNLVKIDNSGGAGGEPGEGGIRGMGGSGGRPSDARKKCEPPDGREGNDGHEGGRGGNPGRNGPAPEFLAEAPEKFFPDTAYAAKRKAVEKIAKRAPRGGNGNLASHGPGGSSSGVAAAGADKAQGGTFEAPAGATGTGGVPVAAFKLRVTDPGTKFKKIEMKADGTVLIDDKPAVKLLKDSLLDASSGNPILSVAADGTVSAIGNSKVTSRMKYAGDDLYLSNTGKISVNDDSSVHVQIGANDAVLGKLEGSATKAKRAVELVILAISLEPRFAGVTSSASSDSGRAERAAPTKAGTGPTKVGNDVKHGKDAKKRR